MAKSKRQPKRSSELRRRPAFRAVPDRVLIVTEGSKTEPSYFRLLINEFGISTAKVMIVGDGGSAPISVVNEAEKLLATDDDFEQVYCVFDRDRHATYDTAVAAIRGLAARRVFRGKTIAAITSIPCFELWYLLHVSDSRRPYNDDPSPAAALVEELRKHDGFTAYQKKDCLAFFADIAGAREDAIARAERFLQDAKAENAREYHENPSTRVHIVVRALRRIAKSVGE